MPPIHTCKEKLRGIKAPAPGDTARPKLGAGLKILLLFTGLDFCLSSIFVNMCCHASHHF